MTNREVRELGFLLKLRALLEEYQVYFKSDDYYKGYPECGQDIRISIENEVGAQLFDVVFGSGVIDCAAIMKQINK